jgi:hypothetical protein
MFSIEVQRAKLKKQKSAALFRLRLEAFFSHMGQHNHRAVDTGRGELQPPPPIICKLAIICKV